MVFTGTYEHTIDAKHRLAIPAEVRSALLRERGPVALDPAGGEQPLFVYVTLGRDCLSLYTEKGFEQRAAELDQSQLQAEDLLEYERLLFSLARRVEMDANGRIRLPDNLLSQAALPTEVVLIGVKDHLEIRDRQQWQAHVARMLREKPQLLMNPRQAMRSQTAS